MIGSRVFDVIRKVSIIAVVHRLHRRVAKIPCETVQSGVLGERWWRREPVLGSVGRRFVECGRAIGELSRQMVLRIVNGELEVARRYGFQKVVNDPAIRWIVAGGSFRR